VKSEDLASRVRVPIVFLHGSVADASVWEGLRKWMGVKALAWDLLDDAGLSIWEWTQQFVEAMRKIGAVEGPPILIGYSLGGRLALHAILAAPEVFSAAVLVGASPGIAGSGDRTVRLQTDGMWARKAREMLWQDFLAEWDSQSLFRGELDPLVVDWWRDSRLALVDRREAIAATFENWSPARQAPLFSHLAEISLPVLCLAGEEDGRYAGLAKEFAGRIPLGEYGILAGVGHRVPWEVPGVFFERVGRFCGVRGLLLAVED